ncbi:bifunctional phosphoribosyl-AMP cyclohydrolase/phosphoribosyl-ATP diphosphatase HisIE [Paraferrimonas sedimenticola]|uniref:Histidine biosynthesis bifunctional protein HisIE n=1 Tax=Paraferrimonas sedimenticola TaxID=375674 RepID=A0AA37VXF7_9GAMM|nr:bifunctional phosphoribosyl-AMP cyclohydrolase/phosphoribosyl-ATP diphosphatase HisIE [Paraferrimonas sedimenticola]GLP96519.1 histidine biosynthesis bifunctional protein HisIE [Paraferrimonas sedimenticola]
MSKDWQQDINWKKVDGMIPVIVQHYLTGRVLMLGYMNDEALTKTLDTSKVTFFSRTKQRLWTKGESSGHFLNLDHIVLDCDQDTLLIQARPQGPTCHLGAESCFDANKAQGFLGQLEGVITQRQSDAPESSYTASLFAKGDRRIAQKVGEEGVEVALAAATGDKQNLIDESADLLYHLLVCLRSQDVSLETVLENLHQRHQPKD